LEIYFLLSFLFLGLIYCQEVGKIMSTNDEKIDQCTSIISDSFNSGDINKAKEEIIRLQYLGKIREAGQRRLGANKD
jgi:hypothetical protein